MAPIEPSQVPFEAGLQSYLVGVPSRARLGIRLALVVCVGALWLSGGRSAHTPAEARAEALNRLLTSRIYAFRQLATLLKMVGTLLYTRMPEVRGAMLGAAAVPSATVSGTRLVRRADEGGHDAARRLA